jgi:amino acid transporter
MSAVSPPKTPSLETASGLPRDAGLRRGVMPTAELMAQAIANIAPSAVVAFIPATIYTTATNGTWLSFLFATIVILAVGYCVSQFAKRRASAGSLYTYAAHGLGPFGAYITGVTLIIGCFGIAAGSLSGCVSYTMLLLDQLGVTISGLGAQIVLVILLGALATTLTIRGIRVSARTALVLELVSITIITFVLIYALTQHSGPVFDKSQFTLKGISGGGIATGMVLAILGFVGFSSADALGREARNPFKAIPRAIMFSALAVGVLYVFASYSQVVLLGKELDGNFAPMDQIAANAGMPNWFKPILTFGITASFFAVVVAPINVIGRIVYVMGKEGVVPGALGRTHDDHLTPHRAILAIAPLVLLLDIVLYLVGASMDEVLVWVDTFGTYGYMIAYAVLAIATPIFLRRIGVSNTLVIVAATVAVVAMAYVFYKNVYPVPEFPLNIIPYVFFAVVAGAVGWYMHLKRNRPETVRAIGSLETDVLDNI